MSAYDPPKRTLAGLVTTPFRALPRVVRCPVLSLGEAMRRRNKTGGKAAKTQRRKTLSRRNAPKSARNRRSSAARQETEVARLTRELHKSREQQAATSEVLGVISSSPGELGPVFEAISKTPHVSAVADLPTCSSTVSMNMHFVLPPNGMLRRLTLSAGPKIRFLG